jgi:hypothetical protein
VSDYELETYRLTASLYNSEDATFWARNTLLVAIQAAMLSGTTGIMVTFGKDFPQTDRGSVMASLFLYAFGVVCAIGMLTAGVWILMVRRSAYLSHLIEKRLGAIETYFMGPSPAPAKAALKPFTEWDRLLSLNHLDRRREFPTKPYFFGGWRLSHLWTAVGLAFLIAWVVLALLVWAHRAAFDASKDGASTPPSAAVIGPVEFAPFSLGSAERRMCDGEVDTKALETTLKAVESVRTQGLSPLVLLLGGTDRVRLSNASRQQYDTNAGLGQARAAAIRQCLWNAASVAQRDATSFVMMDAGPGFTPREQVDAAASERGRERDRIVRALVLAVSHDQVKPLGGAAGQPR